MVPENDNPVRVLVPLLEFNLPGQWAGIFDLLRAVRLRQGAQDAAWPKSLLEFWILGVIRVLGLLLCVQMVEVLTSGVKAQEVYSSLSCSRLMPKLNRHRAREQVDVETKDPGIINLEHSL